MVIRTSGSTVNRRRSRRHRLTRPRRAGERVAPADEVTTAVLAVDTLNTPGLSSSHPRDAGFRSTSRVRMRAAKCTGS
jgi:hypothetical protein